MLRNEVALAPAAASARALAAAVIVCAVTLAAPGGVLGSSSALAQSAAVSAFPIPGSRVASPKAQIAFRGVSPAALGQITVTGSSSGVHAGRIAGDSDGDGASFLPSTPFRPGETVTVTTSLSIAGASNGTFQFTIATPAGGIPPMRLPRTPRAAGDVWRYRSDPYIAPAGVRVRKWSAGSAPGDVFVAPQFGPVQAGPEIVGPGGGLVWFHPVPGIGSASDFRVQTYRGQPVLTWWQGYQSAGVGVGQDQIYDSSYRPVATVQAVGGVHADLHEFELTPQSTALITAYYPVYQDASSVHGSKREIVLDSIVQEIDIPTGLLLFEWDSLDHVPLTASYARVPGSRTRNPYDYFHVNSVQEDSDGSLLISGRNTWAVYKVNHQTAQTIWTLGGKQSSFRLGPGASFEFQHDARVQAGNDLFITLFDDGAGPPAIEKQSRAIKLILDLKRMTARLVAQHRHGLLANFEGGFQQLPNLDDFVGWGQQPYFSEYDRHGRLLFDASFVGVNATYRAYRFQWNGTPTTPPAVAYAAGRRPTADVSWNGATNVSSWRVLGGSSTSALKPLATARKRWFDTSIRLRSAPRYVVAQALDARGRVLGTSPLSRAR